MSAITKDVLATKRIHIDWASGALKAPLEYANQVFVQNHERMILLTFMAGSPPIFVGDIESVSTQVELVGDTVTANCISKIAITPESCRSLIKIMENKLRELDDEATHNGS